MRVVVVGLGVQGHKRRDVAGKECVATVDPVNPEAQYKRLEDVPLDSYDAALVCTPDEAKIALLTHLLSNKKHLLVEKPLFADEPAELLRLKQLAEKNRTVCYTAYNHRFEPHFVRMKELLESGRLGQIYCIRMFYGNGTARLVRDSAWRDQGAGVLPDLGSHLLDTALFWFGEPQRRVHYPVGQSVREPRVRPRRLRRERLAGAPVRDDAALVAQPLLRRRLRREGQRTHQLALQMGAEHVHRARPQAAERPARTRSR